MGAIEKIDRNRQCFFGRGGYRRGESLEFYDVVDPTTERVIAHIAGTGKVRLGAPLLAAAAGPAGSRQQTARAADPVRKVAKPSRGPGSFC